MAVNVLVIGGGGREHALCWKLAQSPEMRRLYCAPGNSGIAEIAECVSLDINDAAAVAAFAYVNNIGLVVIGPELPLVDGLADFLRDKNIRVFGPSAKAAQLEGSKGFTKDLCRRAHIPTARYERFDHAAAAHAYVSQQGAPIVVKADGLAAGKGVTVAQDLAAAHAAIDDCFTGRFAGTDAAVVIEEMLIGEEASFFAIVDGVTALPLATAQDHKAVFDGDKGENTGGMGAYSPAPVMTEELSAQVMREIIEPTVAELARHNTPFIGILFAGLMITEQGPQLIEYNVRFGDPECQVLMMRLKSDLLPLLVAASEGKLSGQSVDWHEQAALTVVMANKGYPGHFRKGDAIVGLADAARLPQVQVFHAGTAWEDGRIITAGGRVLNVTAMGDTVTASQKRAYEAVAKISWPNVYFRRDIGWRAVERESKDHTSDKQ